MEGIKKHTVFCRITDGAVKKIRRFRNNTKGVTTVEVILVLVVLLAIVVIFREQLTAIVTGIFSHVNSTVSETILDKGIMPSEKVLDFPVDCNTLTGSVNL